MWLYCLLHSGILAHSHLFSSSVRQLFPFVVDSLTFLFVSFMLTHDQ